MGCDIHIIAEVKENGVWKSNRKRVFPNPWYDEEEKSKPKEQQWKGRMYKMQSIPDDGRNYDWFAVLADVRNGRGFAGVVTGAGFDVIAEPRGVPDDASTTWKNTVKRWDGDMHSHSYLYIEDFDNFDWTQLTTKEGMITLEQYKELRGTSNAPESWCGGAWGADIITISEAEANQILDGNDIEISSYNYKNEVEVTKKASEWGTIYVHYEWPVLYSEWFDFKIKNVVEPLRKLKEQYEDARIVFGFDN